MKRGWSLALVLLVVLVQPAVAAAAERPSVMVVVEGSTMAAQLRERLSEQLDVKVISPTEAARGVAPDAVLAMRYGAGTGLAVSYVDRHGFREALTLKAPNPNGLLDLAYGTATALLSRHMELLKGRASSNTGISAADFGAELHATFARSVQLRVRDSRSVRITALPLRVEDF